MAKRNLKKFNLRLEYYVEGRMVRWIKWNNIGPAKAKNRISSYSYYLEETNKKREQEGRAPATLKVIQTLINDAR